MKTAEILFLGLCLTGALMVLGFLWSVISDSKIANQTATLKMDCSLWRQLAESRGQQILDHQKALNDSREIIKKDGKYYQLIEIKQKDF
ncbi:MAG: hypothetical protein RLZZ181_1009 [Pseudomonadota bacterium]|jgi:hypothetical protein